MNTLTAGVIVLVCVAAFAVVLAVLSLATRALEKAQGINELAERRWAAERKDLVDRLMARDLTEVKQAQVIEARAEGARATSMGQNEKRIAEQNKRAEENSLMKRVNMP